MFVAGHPCVCRLNAFKIAFWRLHPTRTVCGQYAKTFLSSFDNPKERVNTGAPKVLSTDHPIWFVLYWSIAPFLQKHYGPRHLVHGIPFFAKQHHLFLSNGLFPRRDGNDTKPSSLRNPHERSGNRHPAIRKLAELFDGIADRTKIRRWTKSRDKNATRPLLSLSRALVHTRARHSAKHTRAMSVPPPSNAVQSLQVDCLKVGEILCLCPRAEDCSQTGRCVSTADDRQRPSGDSSKQKLYGCSGAITTPRTRGAQGCHSQLADCRIP